MVWQNPVLLSGTALQKDAMYKFPSVTVGVYALVTIKDIINGATLTSIDDNTYGYSAAWQPIVKSPTVQGASTSYVIFKIEFKDSANGQNHQFDCFQLSFIDVDGDNANIKEFVAAKNPDSVQLSTQTEITLTSLPGSIIQGTGPLTNYTNIDTSAWATNINYKYYSKQGVDEVWVGNITNATFTAQDRYSCGYFTQVTMPTVNTLPVKYVSFDAASFNTEVTLKWKTEDEINNRYFEVERSLDGIHFKTLDRVADADIISLSNRTYFYKDYTSTLKAVNYVFYRLKQVDKDGEFTYSGILRVHLQSSINNGVKMLITPNPFTENLNVEFTSTVKGSAQVQILTLSGQKILTQQDVLSKGNNSIQVQGISKLIPGVYVAQLVVNGEIINNQKIIKN
jgi:hypothetical protein